MGNAPRKPSTPPHGNAAPKTSAERAQDDLEEVELLGVARVQRGYVLVKVTIKGDKILEKDVLSRSPEPKVNAVRRLQSESIKTWLGPQKGVSA